MNRPIIGLTLDFDEASSEYRLARDYADAVLAAGGLPIPIPFGDTTAAGAYLSRCQGLVITGGGFDIPPERYGETRRAACGPAHPTRTAFETAICQAALAGHFPVLGICGGMQLIAVASGGTLYQDLPEDLGISGHRREGPGEDLRHSVEAVPGSLLAELIGTELLEVNSTHHQAVRKLGEGVRVSARSSDGVVEAIELPDLPFAVGVQWHPERLFKRDSRHLSLWRALVERAQEERP